MQLLARIRLAVLFLAASCHSDQPATEPVLRAKPEGTAEPSRLRVLSYNTYYVFAEGKEVDAGSNWIREQSPDLVALQELTNLSPQRLEELAAAWGHAHSALLKTQGFSVGLTSHDEIEVVERIEKGLHHGCLHAVVNDIHVFVVHLSPFRWKVRQQEAQLLLTKIQPLLDQQFEILVLGDFNALSPHDGPLLELQPTLLEKALASDAEHAHVQNLRQGTFDYSVMGSFFDAGLVDAVLPFVAAKDTPRWTIPTGIWSTAKDTPPEGGTRVDYVLASASLAETATTAAVVRDGIVNKTSDHYPIVVDFHREDGR